tara:strand:- start:214 stop:2646 length:2433 start_codon:yes stop_codon:yes gene_type:complete
MSNTFENMITIWANLKFHKNGKKMKADNTTFPKGWNKTKKSIIRDDIKYKAVLTGKINNIIVLDFDTPKNNELDGIKFYHDNYDLFKNTFIEKSISGKGFHVYYKYNPLLKSKTRINGDNGLSIDILNERGNKTHNMAIIGTPINNNEMQEMPEEVINLFDLKPNTREVITEFDYDGEVIETNYEDLEKIRALVSILTKKESDNRQIWIAVGKCLLNILEDKKEAFNIWDTFSRLSNKYNGSEIIEQWNSFKISFSTIGTLIHYCKEYKIKFKNWTKEYLSKDKNLDLSKIVSKYNIDSNLHNLIISDYCDLDIAEWFLYEYKNKFIYYDNKLYAYNDKFWEKHSDKTVIFNIISNIYYKLEPIYNDIINELMTDLNISGEIGKMWAKYFKSCKKALKNTSGCNSVNEFIINRITKNENLFDLNENLICFSNGTYDLDLGLFRNPDPLDYITLSTQYDYNESSQSDKDFVFEYLNKIMSCPKKLDILLLALASGLRGITFEKFIILTGAGRNSKDTLITYIMKAVLGNYYYLGNTGSITSVIKEGVNVGLCNLENKRFVVFNEPADGQTIKISTVKYITGANSINTRGLYSSKTDIPICPSMFLMCNDIPKLDHVDDAIKERLVIISFNSLFRESDYFVENEVEVGKNDIFMADDNVKHKDFLSKMKLPFMNILLDYFKIFKNNGFKLGTLPDSIKNENKKYLINSDEFTSWLNDSYIKTNDKNDIIKIKDIYSNYKFSDLFVNLNKIEKRNNNYSNFKEKIMKNPNLRLFYHLRKKINGKDYDNILTNYKINDEDKDDDETNYDNLKFE